MVENQIQEYIYLKAPYEDETCTYIKSFSIDQKNEIKEFFDTYGFVAVRDVLTPEECEISVDEVFENLNENSFRRNIVKDDIESYQHVGNFDQKNNKFQDEFCRRFGLVGGGCPVFLPQAMKNRQNENIYKAYCYATGREKFLVAYERYGFMRPTKDHPDWNTLQKWLHIDMNTLTGITSTYGYLKNGALEINPKQPLPWQHAYFQGIVALRDCPEATGGLNLVPGFQKSIVKWTEENKQECLNGHYSGDPTTIHIPDKDELQNHVQKIPIRRGTLVIWDGRLPHSNFPNTGGLPRFVQYIKMNAVDDGIQSYVISQYEENKSIFEVLKKDGKFELSSLGKKLYGAEQW